MSQKIDIKKIREEKGITLQQAFEDTKISKRILEAIESGDLSDLFISPVYIKGFIKSYARYLGIDPDQLVHQLFDEQFQDSSVIQNQERSSNKKIGKRDIGAFWVSLFSVFRTGIVLITAFVLGHLVKIPRKIWLMITIVVVAVGAAILWPAHKANLPQVKAKTALVKPKENLKSSEIQTTVEKNKEVVKKGVSVLVEAKEDCWLRVKCDGIELFRGTLHKGDIERWKADKELSLWVGNAGALKIVCNGKHYENIGRKGQVIKELVFTPDGSYHIRKR